MKKIYSFALIILTLFSCVLFSACGNKYADLRMKVYSESGEEITELNFVIDETKELESQKISIEFFGLDKKDIGTIKVYSAPYGLISDTEYRYEKKSCSVKITPEKPSAEGAKLVVFHKSSGKTKEIDLNIEQKSQNLQIVNSTYLVEIKDSGMVNNHIIDFSKLVQLIPMGSTDDVYFKVDSALPEGITAKPSTKYGGGLYEGFSVTTDEVDQSKMINGDLYVDIYPVTCMSDYDNVEYVGKKIRVEFRKILKDNEILIRANNLAAGIQIKDDAPRIELISNDDSLNTFKLSWYLLPQGQDLTADHKLNDEFYEIYEIQTQAPNSSVSVFADADNNINLIGNVYTDDFVKLRVTLNPIYEGQAVSINKDIYVKVHARSDEIEIRKNSNLIVKDSATGELKTNIFDYYEDGNVLGALFEFKPIAKSGIAVHEDLNSMRLYVSPAILSEANDVNNQVAAHVGLGSALYNLEIRKFNQPLNFTLENDMMVSEEFDENTRIYIKYVIGNEEGDEKPLGLTVKTYYNAVDGIEYWSSYDPTEVDLSFIRLEGIKSMGLEASTKSYPPAGTPGTTVPVGTPNPYIYLNRKEGLDDGEYIVKLIDIVKVIGADNGEISQTELFVEVTSLTNGVANPLRIYDGLVTPDWPAIIVNQTQEKGVDSVTHSYNKGVNTSISLVFRTDTSIGQYEVAFYQEGIKKASVICVVYEPLDGLDGSMINIETSKTAFENIDYTDVIPAKYIVAANQDLKLFVNLPDDVLNSDIVVGYEYKFIIRNENGEQYNPDPQADGYEAYFSIARDEMDIASAWMNFKKGTFISENILEKYKYVDVSVSVLTKQFVDIVTVNASENTVVTTPENTVTFYIYEEIKKADIILNHSPNVRYFEEYLGEYYKDKANVELEIVMRDDLWNYVTPIDGNNNIIKWTIDDTSGLKNANIPNTKNWNFTFIETTGESEYKRVVKCYIQQFETTFELSCEFDVYTPIVTEKLVITSDVLVTDDDVQEYYINLKNGGEYQVTARNESNSGEVTHPEIMIQVADKNGLAIDAQDYFDIDQTAGKIKVKKVAGSSDKKFKLIVFAKDALIYPPTSHMANYNNPSSFLLETVDNKTYYNNAYFVIDIYLSDGTSENPYLIHNANDFWQIDDSEEFKTSFYEVRSSFSIDGAVNSEKFISGFRGVITTHDDNIYTIDGVRLNASRVNLFDELRDSNAEEKAGLDINDDDIRGIINNLRFIVNIDYEIVANNSEYNLGLIGINAGTLNNVSVSVIGSASLDGRSATYNIGALVGKNSGTILYDSNSVIGVSGSMGLTSASNNSTIYFGGLVGLNEGTIKSTESASVGGENTIVLSTSSGRQGALSTIVIIVDENIQTNVDSAFGGAIGYNHAGIVQNAFVEAKITAINASNVGGVIGKNSQLSLDLNMTGSGTDVTALNDDLLSEDYKNKAIYNVKSASIVKGLNNVGGVVGFDDNGLYIEVDYQILTSSNKAVAVVGNNNVGGIAGQSIYGKFAYCSVMSYNWKYSQDNDKFMDSFVVKVADIEGTNYVGGMIGYAVNNSTLNWLAQPTKERVVVVYSSVNAFVKSTSANKTLGGILATDNTASIIYNAYFIGKLEGEIDPLIKPTDQYLYLTNNIWSAITNVYSVCYNGVGVTIGAYGVNVVNANPNLSYWWQNNDINGGYIFVTTDKNSVDSSLPIFDVAPEDINVTVTNEDNKNLKRTLRLNYYDFVANLGITDDELIKLNNQFNRNEFIIDYYKDGALEKEGLLSFEVKPANLGRVVLNVKSTNSNIVDINYDGRIIINGVGECDLIFSSVLNPAAGDVKNRTIHVVVDYPLGDEFHVGTSKNDYSKVLTSNDVENIAKGSSKQYYILTKGEKEHDAGKGKINYSYKTKNNFSLEIKVEKSGVTICDYLSIGAAEGTQNGNALIFNLDNKTPFIISVLKSLEGEGEAFDISVTPYIVINGEPVTYKNVSDNIIKAEFKLATKLGASEVAFSYDEAIVYPNDTVYLTINIKTDVELTEDNIIDLLFNNATIVGLTYNITLGVGILYNVSLESYSYNAEEQNQVIKLKIEFDDMELTSKANFSVKLETEYGNFALVEYTILPQRINDIEIKNYYYKNELLEDGSTKLVLVKDNVLKPNNAGKMIIDIVPDNGYFDYLEISDITGNEEILFIQTNAEGNKAFNSISDPSSDGKGIKLYQFGNEKGRFYIKTQIDKNYSSKIHTVEIRAYLDNGTLLARQTCNIDVKMLPNVVAQYVLPSGEEREEHKVNSSGISQRDLLLANGVDANFNIQTENSNTELEVKLSGYLASKYEFIHDVGNNYVLKRTAEFNSDDINQEITITLKTRYEMANGDFDEAECSITFTMVDFVIHGVSVNSSIDNLSKHEIYGKFDKPVHLNFYFNKYDISFYDTTTDNEHYWDTVYRYRPGIEESVADEKLKIIYTILMNLNGYDPDNGYAIKEDNQYLSIKQDPSLNADIVNKISLAYNKLTVQKGYDPNSKLEVKFGLKYDTTGKTWTMEPSVSDEDGYITFNVNKVYDLNFTEVNNWYEPIVIKNEEDFLNMTSGGDYILSKDLTLKEYVPLDVNLVQFDGNGRTITIQSFGLFIEPEIKAGLFKQIYEGMIVKNVVVKYEGANENGIYPLGYVESNKITYYDICNDNKNVNYTSAKFGGITAINNGIITNCTVLGEVVMRASTIEQKKFENAGNYEINFFIGGMAVENSQTGFITNSSTELNIYSQANIGGFVYENSGKIASCEVGEDTTIYGYNTSLEKTIVVKLAGFVVENNNEISMSYVSLKKGDVKYNNTIYAGTMSAKDISAGFAYSNHGKILDSYVSMTNVGVNNNLFSGFVYANSGSVTRAYTFINNGVKASGNDNMFAGIGTENLTDCLEFLANKNSTNSSTTPGLTTIDSIYRLNKETYEMFGFAFGDNESAVWKMDSGSLPVLVSTSEKVVHTGSTDQYQGLMPIVKKEVTKEDGNIETKYVPSLAFYGTKENPYIITDLVSWKRFIADVDSTIAYYRIVCDIDFGLNGDNPITSTVTFKGNIQGNNMVLNNIMLYSTDSLESLGLFKRLESANDLSIKNSVRNLTLTTTSVWASKTSAVGLLAGVAEDFNLYNINIDAANVIMVGGNAVGGLVGVARGEFDIDQISSNVGVNSTRASTLHNYSIYLSKNNKENVSKNLSSVYYAGPIVGILDGYNRSVYNINNERDIAKKYFMVRNISVNGNVSIIGDSVGGAFGLIGERVHVKNVDVNISGALIGYQYAAGIAGENRGVISSQRGKVVLADNIFDENKNISAGVVGFNLGGLVQDVYAQANIHRTGHAQIVGGIIGRNVFGSVVNACFDGELSAYYTGGIVGANYSNRILINSTTGAGTISAECRQNGYLIPQNQIVYKKDNVAISNFSGVSLTRKSLDYMINSYSKYYSYKNTTVAIPDLEDITVENRVLGLIVGLSYDNEASTLISSIVGKDASGKYNINVTDELVVFNAEPSDKINMETIEDVLLFEDAEVPTNNVEFDFVDVNLINLGGSKHYVLYLVGAKSTSFDSWSMEYTNQYVLIK